MPIVTDPDGRPNAKSSLAQFEVDGWKARSGDFGNHHCYRYAAQTYTVMFSRYMEKQEEDGIKE